MSHAKSTRQKLLEGHPNRSLLKSQAAPRGTPVKPTGLGPIAAQFWDRYTPQLITLGLATEIDGPLLEMLATYWGLYQGAKNQITEQHDFSDGDTSRLFRNLNTAHDNFKKLALQFGLTPLARNALTLTEPPSELDEFFTS